MAGDIWTIGRLLTWTQNFFASKDILSARLDAEVLLAHTLKKNRIYLYVHFDEPLNVDELAVFRMLVKKRAGRIPVAYLVGQKEFMGLAFKVNEHTLVPRPETEILVQAVLDRLPQRPGENLRGADIGTGTGAIALSLAKYRPQLMLTATDISPDALAVAQENATRLNLAAQVQFATGSLTEPLTGKSYHVIVSNPPYIPTRDINALAPEVRQEPRSALDGGTDGLDFYRRLAEKAPIILTADGFLALEVGINQADAVAGLCEQNKFIARTEIIKDLAGISRVVIAWRGGR